MIEILTKIKLYYRCQQYSTIKFKIIAEIFMTVFDRVKELAERRGISIVELEEKLDFGRNSLYSWWEFTIQAQHKLKTLSILWNPTSSLSWTPPVFSYSNGVLEGTNRMIKQIQRTAFGMSNFNHLVARINLRQMKTKPKEKQHQATAWCCSSKAHQQNLLKSPPFGVEPLK